MMESLVFLVLGLVGLWLGSQLAIGGFEDVARRFGISHLFIGLTVVAIGTSLPEIGVSVIGAVDILMGAEMSAVSGIVVGNKIGSYINQLTIIMGIVGLVGLMSTTRARGVRASLLETVFNWLSYGVSPLLLRVC